MKPEWLKDAVFYEIYPSSFRDSNRDGMGDINGITEKLDYIRYLGCNALWLNPCFDSPFLDGGYDIRDYRRTAARFGTNGDLERLFREAHARGIYVLLDLVPGHTSDTHPWFTESAKAEHNEYSGRYVWTDHPFKGIDGHPYISGMKERGGAYMLNFFASQPALNYGWLNRTESWMSAVDSPEAVSTREAVKDIMRFWLDCGCDGFRVDMADSLVKNDDEHKSATAAVWRNIREMLDREYPEAVLVSEWSNPEQAINGGGFHMDFYLDHHGNGYNTLLRDYETGGEDRSWFRKDSGGDIQRFLSDWLPKYLATRDNGFISMFTCNHDTPRPARTLSAQEMKLFAVFLMTMPGVPFIYYGDEIGMRWLDIPTKEGGYQRTGSRTPMQWDDTKHMGFSDADTVWLPQDPSAGAPKVSEQMGVKGSLLETYRELTALRHRYPALQAEGPYETVFAEGGVYVYRRSDILIGLNPSGRTVSVDLPEVRRKEVLWSDGICTCDDHVLTLGPQTGALLI